MAGVSATPEAFSLVILHVSIRASFLVSLQIVWRQVHTCAKDLIPIFFTLLANDVPRDLGYVGDLQNAQASLRNFPVHYGT